MQAAQTVQTQVAGALTKQPPILSPAQQALAAPGGQVGPTLQRAEMASVIPEMTPNQIKATQYQNAADILAANGRIADAEKYQTMAEKLNPRAEVVGQPFEVTDATGKPILVQQYKDGKLQTMSGYGPKREVVLQNFGGQTVAINKSALRGGETYQQTMTPGEVASNRVALGNLAVAQGGLGLRQREFDRGGYQIKETEGGGMVYVPTAPGGMALPVMAAGGQQVKGAGGAPTEGQSNAAGFAQRMELAQNIIGGLPAGSQPGAGTRIAEAVPFVGGALARSGQSPDTQKYDQAAQDWIRAKLRKESGAAIGADEMKQEYATYFPMVGDTAEKIAQKAEARRVVTLGMQKSAGRAYQPYVPPEPPPAAATSAKKMVWDGTKFVFQ